MERTLKNQKKDAKYQTSSITPNSQTQNPDQHKIINIQIST